MKSLLPYLAIAGLLFSGCGEPNTSQGVQDTPTAGSIQGSADESLRSLVEAELYTFHSEYPKAKIQVDFKAESEAIEDLLQNKARFAITTRKLSKQELAVFESEHIRAREVKIAVDAVCLISNKALRDTQMTMPNLKAILEGKITQWDQIKSSNKKEGIQLVVDHSGSSSLRHLKDSVFHLDSVRGKVYALKNADEVINYVEKHPNAIGLLGAAWISDRDDSTVNTFLNRVRIMDVLSPQDGEYYKPYQAYIALKSYPLTRSVYYLLKEPRTGLGTGFSNFIAGDKGQRIILKLGLVPATMPVRLVKVKKDGL